MRKRDAAIVVLSFFGLLLSLGNEGAISFRKAWCEGGGAEGVDDVASNQLEGAARRERSRTP